MTFKELLAQVMDWLHQDKRISYRALKRQFSLSDDDLDDLKEAIFFAYPEVADEEGRGLVWAGDRTQAESDRRRGAEAEIKLYTVLRAVMALLQHEKRVTYRELKQSLDLDDALLEAIREEFVFKQVARDEQGQGLVLIREIQLTATPIRSPVLPVAAAVTSPGPPNTEVNILSNEPIVRPEAVSTDIKWDEPAKVPELARATFDAERRQLTVMFCDLVGSTDLSGKLDPEDLREVVRAYQETATEVIERYEGHIAQYLGDGLLIYFGFPVAHEDDAQRAVHSGLGIVEVMDTLNTRLEADYGVELAVRIGIHTGPVVVGEMGSGGRHENLALGETPNVAARLEGLAPSNAVMISSVTARLVQSVFALGVWGAHELKGVAEPMVVSRVLGLRGGDEDETPTAGFAALVGRDEEIGLLLRCWEQSQEGLGQVVLISGEAGIGKSSLVDGLREHVRQEGYIRIAMRCSSYTTNSAFYPVIAHMHRVLDWQPDDNAETKLDKLEHSLQGRGLPLEEAVPLFAALLSLPLPQGRYPTLEMTSRQQRQQTLDSLVAWLLEEAERQPVLVVWEDVHWADPSTLELLELHLGQTPTAPILNVLTFRPEFVPPWPMRSYMTPLTLNRLGRPQIEALIARLAGGKALPPAVVEHIFTKTDGVPLFVEELTKMLLESSLLRQEDAHYTLTGSLAATTIPATLHDSLMARLDRYPTAREIAQLGAVMGREFTYEMLQAIAPLEDTTLQAGLDQLVAAELLYQRGRLPRARYLFKHVLVQDAAYASLLKSTRQQVHHQIAQLLEARFATTVETQPELIAYHYTAAGLSRQALSYWHQAGQQAVQGLAYAEAISHLTQGLRLIETLPDTPERAQHELHFQAALGPVLMTTKGFAALEVEQVYARAWELCQYVEASPSPELAPVLWGLSRFYTVRGALQRARDLGDHLLALAQHINTPLLEMIAHLAQGIPLFWLGEFPVSYEHVKQSMARYDVEEHRTLAMHYGLDLGGLSRCYAAFNLWMLGYPDQSLACIHEAITLAQDLSHPPTLAFAQTWAAQILQLRREWGASLQWAERAQALTGEKGMIQQLGSATMYRSGSLIGQGQLKEGIAEMQKGIEAWRATGSEVFVPYNLTLLAEAYDALGDFKTGLQVLNEALTQMATTGERCYEAEARRLKGKLLLHATGGDEQTGELPDACFQQALEITRHQQAKSLELRVAMSLSRLWQKQGKREEACELLAPVYNWFTEGFDTADLVEAKVLLEALRE